MLQRRRDDLAVASLRDFKALIVDATPRLENSGSQANSTEVTSKITQMKTELTAVSAANLEPDGSTPAEMAAVDGAVQAAEKAVTQVETSAVPREPAPTEAAGESTP